MCKTIYTFIWTCLTVHVCVCEHLHMCVSECGISPESYVLELTQQHHESRFKWIGPLIEASLADFHGFLELHLSFACSSVLMI